MRRGAPTVAVVGRPNVGKSTLFNRLTGARRAIVHATPGVTRDVQRGEAEWNGVTFTLVDTGGVFAGIDDPLITEVERRAIEEARAADAVLFVVDASEGVVASDEDVAREVRRIGAPVLLVANKADARGARDRVAEFHRLGFDAVYPVSAVHGEGTGDLLDDLVALLPGRPARASDPSMRLAIVGVPNVGKSSLVNALAEDARHIVDERPGTTRDAVDVVLRWRRRDVTLVDTAGLRRRARTQGAVDTISAVKSLESIERCDVAVVVLDASRPVSAQDVRVAGYAHRAGRGVVVCFNKWDLVQRSDRAARDLERAWRTRAAFVSYAPVIFASARTGHRVGRILETAWRVHEQHERRIPTAEVNRFVERIVRAWPPPTYGGATARVYYATQVETAPPTFALFVNRARAFGRNYIRWINNRLREAFGFEGTQIRIRLVERKGGKRS